MVKKDFKMIRNEKGQWLEVGENSYTKNIEKCYRII